jgi:phosphatidylglycerophosphatase A
MKATDRAALVLATWFGCGLGPKAPGTFGALGAIPLHLLLSRLSPVVHVAAVVVLSGVGIWASHRAAIVWHEKDPQRVVIDEVAGVLIAMGMVRSFGLWANVAGFVLFRFFDITKPGPIRRAEHLPPVGFGIMADDLAAGVVAGIIARLGVLVATGA